MSKKKKCGIVGIGNRAHSWMIGIVELHNQNAELTALCDLNTDRCHDANRYYETNATVYSNYEEMLEKEDLDIVVVTTPESFHADNIARALDAGCDVATEKPLCITGDDAKKILDAEERNGKKIFMAFNYRHIPLASKVKELILADEIGKPVSMDLTWYLDYKGHGASYFRRWHRLLEKSGGLLVTKASHHFDLANWWMGDIPEKVYGNCTQNFFGPGKNPYKGTRCSECEHGEKCEWYTDVCIKDRTKELSEELGYKVRTVRDYIRDYCPFGDEVDIYDTMAVQVKYKNGGLLNYSLNASVPFEGWNLAINGTKGRLETKITDKKPAQGWQKYFKMVGKDGSILNEDGCFVSAWPENYSIFVMPHDKNAYEIDIPNIAEGHGGGDYKVFEAVFGSGIPAEDPLNIFASAINGALSTGIGSAANISSQTGEPVMMSDMLGKWAE
jgi:predicted dehydrogenase